MAYIRMIIGVLIAIGVLAGISAGVQAQSDDELVAEWHFDEGAGSVLKDSSGNGNDGVIYGATWTEGKYGHALKFDGIDDYLEIPSNSDLRPPKNFALEAWAQFDDFNDYRTIIMHDDNGGGDDGYFLRADKNGKVQFFIGRPYAIITSDKTLTSGMWYHIVGIYDSNYNLRIYINGVEDTNSPKRMEGDVVYSLTKNLNFGRRGGTFHPNTVFMKGCIDEVRIYNRALASEEIKEHYEQGTTALSLIKTASPQSIKQGQTATITLTIKNTGSTEISDIEIADTIPSYLTFIDGEISKTYESLAPKDTRQISYTLQFNDAGTFNFEPAIATYADDKGNYNTVKSKTASIEVIRSIIENSAPTPKPTNGKVQSASVNLHGEKTDVALGEDVLLKLSAVNIIGNPTMHVQVIIIPPSGWSVTSSEFAKSGAGQYTTTYELESGGGKDIEVRIVPNQIGDDFQVEGRIIYYFGDDVSTREDHTLSLPIKVRAESDDIQTPSTDSEESKTPGFGVLVAVIGLLMTAHLIKRK